MDSGPLAVLIAAVAGALFLFLVVLPRRRDRREPVIAGPAGIEPVIVKSDPPARPAPRPRAPALANVPSLDDESVAQLLRLSPEEEAANIRPGSPGSGALKRRSQLRPRTTRDLQAGS